MTEAFPQIYLARHAETAWTVTRQHTGKTDIPLNEEGQQHALRLKKRLHNLLFASVYTSPLERAKQTCQLCGFGSIAEIDPDLSEWHYGIYEGATTADIRKDKPNWQLFRDGCPQGETITALGIRADRVIARLRRHTGNVLIFSHGHFMRFIAARWLGLPPEDARFFLLSTASLGILGYEHGLEEPVIRLWNDVDHLK